MPNDGAKALGRLHPFLLAMAMLLATPSQPQPVAAASIVDRFQLFTQCSRMGSLIQVQADRGNLIGLTEDAVRRAVNSRLRSARLLDDTIISPYLYIHIQVLGSAFSIKIDFYKEVKDSYTGLSLSATTWKTGYTGTSSNSGYIISTLGQGLDKFLDEYLRVNEEDC